MARIFLFCPGNEERKVQNALASGSDAVVLDLEDSVSESQKAFARHLVTNALREGAIPPGLEVWVRVNGTDTEAFFEDLKDIDWQRAAGAILPKAEDPSSVRRLKMAGVRRVILLVESAAGLVALPQFADVREDVERIAIGTWDLSLDLGLIAIEDPDDSELMWQVRGQVVVQSRILGLKSPVDGINARLDDDVGLRAVCERALRLGYGGKLLIHPRQIAIARSIFEPSPEALQFAQQVVATYEMALTEGRGAVRLRGRAIDRPMLDRARALLASID